MRLRNILAVFFVLSIAVQAWTEPEAISAKNKKPFPVKYVSETDQKISIKTVTLAPVYDNVNSVYSASIQKLLVDLLQSDKTWGYAEFPDMTKKIFVETFDTKPKEVLDILDKTKTQALMTAMITKGPNGLTARLKFYTQDQGLILLEENFQDLNTFEVAKVREEFVTLYHRLKNKLPYQGSVLSRRGLDVTLNVGEKNGVKVGQEVALAQILKLNRHPKLKTLVGVEKEILGKVQITKVEPYLSFGQIIFEKETGVVEVGAKIIPTDFIAYPKPVINPEGIVTGDRVLNDSDKKSNE